MDIRYEEWLPGCSELRDLITAYWYVSGDGSKLPASSVLPDGHVELVFNFGAPVGLEGPAYRGDQPERTVTGPLSKALRLEYRGAVETFGIRFHPARGSSFLGKAATDLMDRLAPLSEVCPPLDGALAHRMHEGAQPNTEACRSALDRILLSQLPSALPADPLVVELVDRLSEPDGMSRVSEIARESGISARQLQRRFLASVGMPPKRFVRVLRFARVWQLASMSPRDTWAALAAEHGYADQAHLVREFRAFGAEPPTHVFTPGWYDATELFRVSGPAPGVRSVQDGPAVTKL